MGRLFTLTNARSASIFLAKTAPINGSISSNKIFSETAPSFGSVQTATLSAFSTTCQLVIIIPALSIKKPAPDPQSSSFSRKTFPI